jgi:hypothetical protein
VRIDYQYRKPITLVLGTNHRVRRALDRYRDPRLRTGLGTQLRGILAGVAKALVHLGSEVPESVVSAGRE